MVMCLVAAFSAAPTPDDYLCSKLSTGGVRSSQTVYFIGRAQADTLLAGPGPVSYAVTPGHFGPGRDRSIYGQVVRPERMGGSALSRVESPVVLVVPWDYGADCTPTPWSASAQFIPVGHRGFYSLTLRDSTTWPGGVPTFDTHHPLFVPYPSPRDRLYERADDVLTVDELFEVYARLPTRQDIADSAWAAAEGFVSWMQVNAHRQRAYPVDHMANSLGYAAEAARARLMDIPVAGTYRVTVEASGAVADTFFIRTASKASGAWHVAEPYRRDTPRLPWDRRAVGYELYFWSATTLNGLPRDSVSAIRSQRGEWPLSVSEEPIVDDSVTVWRGHFELPQLARSLPHNQSVSALIDAWRDQFGVRWRAGDIAADELRFHRALDGTVTFTGEYLVGSVRRIRVVGERISDAAVIGRRR